MANIKSAKKRIRVTARQTMRNKIVRSKVRTAVRRAREALATGDVEAATETTRLATSELDKAATKHVIHHNNAARRKSRLMRALAKLTAA